MKRSTPLQRHTPLTRTGFDPTGREGMRSSALRRAATAAADPPEAWGDTPIRRAPRGLAAPDPSLPAPARPRKVQPDGRWSQNLGGCAVCGTIRVAREAHHVLARRHIRAYVRSLRLPRRDARRLERRLISDRRNRLALCAGPLGCHMQFEAAMLVIPRWLLPASVWEFAAELGEPYVALLERRYPAA